MQSNFHAWTLWIALAVLGLAGCGKTPQKSSAAITGSVNYAGPLSLPPGSKLQLRLTDVAAEDAAPVVATIETDVAQLPYSYSLPYDPAHINSQHRYTVDARIRSAGQLHYSTDTAYPVLTQGAGTQRDLTVIAVGATTSTATAATMATTQVFQHELRTGSTVSLYRAGMQAGALLWLEEDRSNDTPQPLHARYDFKGALLLHYADSTQLEITFDERGRPVSLHQVRPLNITEHMDIVYAVRNRAALLRSHALAATEAQAHRHATGG